VDVQNVIAAVGRLAAVQCRSAVGSGQVEDVGAEGVQAIGVRPARGPHPSIHVPSLAAAFIYGDPRAGPDVDVLETHIGAPQGSQRCSSADRGDDVIAQLQAVRDPAPLEVAAQYDVFLFGEPPFAWRVPMVDEAAAIIVEQEGALARGLRFALGIARFIARHQRGMNRIAVAVHFHHTGLKPTGEREVDGQSAQRDLAAVLKQQSVDHRRLEPEGDALGPDLEIGKTLQRRGLAPAGVKEIVAGWDDDLGLSGLRGLADVTQDVLPFLTQGCAFLLAEVRVAGGQVNLPA